MTVAEFRIARTNRIDRFDRAVWLRCWCAGLLFLAATAAGNETPAGTGGETAHVNRKHVSPPSAIEVWLADRNKVAATDEKRVSTGRVAGGIALAAAGASLVGAGVYLGWLARSTVAPLNSPAAGAVYDSKLVARAEGYQSDLLICLAVGVVPLVAGIVLLATGAPQSRGESKGETAAQSIATTPRFTLAPTFSLGSIGSMGHSGGAGLAVHVAF